MFADLPILSLLIWLPMLGGVAVIALGDANQHRARQLGVLTAAVALLLSLPLWSGFDSASGAMQFVERSPWIPVLKSEYHLGVDGVSMPLIVLTTFITLIVTIAAWGSVTRRGGSTSARS
jgi:NADH-quinone oxidoreductase subunit M